MNRDKWRKYDRISLDRYMHKLCEEAGEVARELSDLRERQGISGDFIGGKVAIQDADRKLKDMHTELDHVIFIAEQMRARVRLEREIISDALLTYGKD